MEYVRQGFVFLSSSGQKGEICHSLGFMREVLTLVSEGSASVSLIIALILLRSVQSFASFTCLLHALFARLFFFSFLLPNKCCWIYNESNWFYCMVPYAGQAASPFPILEFTSMISQYCYGNLSCLTFCLCPWWLFIPQEGVSSTIQSFSHLARDSSLAYSRDFNEQSKVEKLLGGGKGWKLK